MAKKIVYFVSAKDPEGPGLVVTAEELVEHLERHKKCRKWDIRRHKKMTESELNRCAEADGISYDDYPG